MASIQQFGVLEPVGCRRSPDGTITVRMGRRRVLAAREAEQATIPAYIVDGDDSTVTRLLQQYAENEHRAGLTEPERAAVFQQLAFEGLSIPQIAKQTGVKKAVVESGIKVAASDFAQTVATKHEVTLDQAAAIIEFEGDKDAVNSLVRYAEEAPEQFAHELQRQRDNRARAEAVAAEQARLIELGFTILESRPDSYSDKEHISISELLTTDGNPVTVEDLAKVTPRFAHVRSYYGAAEVEVGYYVTEPKGWGFKKVTSTGSIVGPMTEEQKAERKTLIANNKAWASAEVVRREWLAGFLSRKTVPKDASAFIAQAVVISRWELGKAIEAGSPTAQTLLGLIGEGDYHDSGKLLAYLAQNPARAQQLILAVILGGIEAATDRTVWRNPRPEHAAYLAQLAAWGYPLSEVERIASQAVAHNEEESRLAEGESDEPEFTDAD